MQQVTEHIPSATYFDAPPEGMDAGTILDLGYAHASWAVHACAVELNVFEALAGGPLTSEAVARATNSHPVTIRWLLDGLVALRWLDRADYRYGLRPTSQFFNGSWGLRKTPVQDSPYWGRFLRMLREGRIDPHRGGPQNWGDFAMQRHMALWALAGEFHDTFEILQQGAVFEQARTLIDLAGGHGVFAIGFKRRLPGLDVSLLDLPATLPVAEQFIAAYGLRDVVRTVPGDVYKDTLAGPFDIIFMSNLSPFRSQFMPLCKKVHGALNKGGVFVYKDVVPQTHWSEEFYPLAHKLMMAIAWGDPRASSEWPPTADEARRIMTDVGFRKTRALGWVRRWCTITAAWK